MSNNELICDEFSQEIIKIAERIATNDGPKAVTVRNIINQMGVTNRVFYNRFKNINEVLELVYRRAVIKMRESIVSEIDIQTDFFSYVMDISIKVLVNTYEIKRRFSQFAFEFDSYTDENYKWWTSKIASIIEVAQKSGELKMVDSHMLSYTIWCFFRGYNADVVNRKVSMEQAIENFRFGLNCLFDGIRK